MKFIAILAALAAVASAQYCPITSGSCNTNNTPAQPKTAKLVRQYLVDGYECSGTVEIMNECEFKVTGFKVVAPGAGTLTWYGSEYLNAKSGGNNLKEGIEQTGTETDIVVRTDNNIFCRASLVEHIGVISIMDENYKLICAADFGTASSSSSSGGSSSGSTSGSTSGSSGTTSGTSSGSSSGSSSSSSSTSNTVKQGNNTNNSTSDAKAAYMIPSAIYVIMLSLLYYLYN
eukprot:jgi/Orpsp1_1/1189821/evm.model.d7180000074745.1